MTALAADGETTLSHLVAEEVRALMARRGLKQRHLAEVLGISQQSMGMRLRGRTPFDINELGLIAAYLDVDVVDLLPRRAQTPRPEGVSVIHA